MGHRLKNWCWCAAMIVLVSAVLLVADRGRHSKSTASTQSNIAIPAAVHPLFQIEFVSHNPGYPVDTFYGKINGTVAGQAVLQRYVKLFNLEFGLYPADLVQRTGLRRVVFCEHLSFAGQLRNAVPDFQHDTWYLDVSRGAYDRSYLQRVIHHEFFHIIDWRDGLLYVDPGWDALNPTGFSYGTGGAADQGNPMASVWTDKVPGFLDQYATTAVEEDKAEIFACMMVDPAYSRRRAEKDPVLAAKVVRMKKQLVGFCPSIDEAFWKRISQLPRR